MNALKRILTLVVLAPSLALANGYDVPNVAPRDMAMVSSGVAAPVDAGAVYTNPAGMARLGPGFQMSATGSMLLLNTTWTDNSGLSPSPASTNFKPVPPVALFAMYGGKLGDYDAAIGAGFNVVAGGNVFWDEDWAGRGRIITVDRKIYAGYLSGALALSRFVRVGLSGVYYYGTEYLKIGIQPYAGAFGELATKGGALSVGGSVDITPTDDVAITFDYKHLGTMDLKGDGHFSVPASVAAASCAPGSTSSFCLQDQNVSHELTYPSVLNVAAAFHANKKLLVTAAYTYNWYEVYKEDRFVGDKGALILVPRDYGNGQTFRLGAEYDVDPKWKVRAGVERDLSGLKTDTYSPTLPDGNSWVVAGGAGWQVTPAVQVSGALFYAMMDKVTATGDVAFPGSYETSAFVASVGVSWKPGAK